LARLGVSDIDRFRPYLTVSELRHGDVLADTHQSVDKVYFPHSGIISCVVELKSGEWIETGMIGADGAFGAMQALDDKVSLNRVIIRTPGTASTIEAVSVMSALAEEFRFIVQLPPLYDVEMCIYDCRPRNLNQGRAVWSHLSLDEHLFDLRDGLGRVEVLRADLGAIQDGVAEVEPERVLKIIEPLAARFVAAVHDPAVRLQQDGRPEEAFAGPPIAGTPGAAAGAEMHS
jgi:hypothetical protein